MKDTLILPRGPHFETVVNFPTGAMIDRPYRVKKYRKVANQYGVCKFVRVS
jgi:hypothetical protein